MADPLQNAAFLANLFRPVSDIGQGFGETGVKIANLGYQERLRELKRQQDIHDAQRDFGYRTALTNLQIEGQRKIAEEATTRSILSQEAQTNRLLTEQASIAARAQAAAVTKELAEAKKQYRVLAGKDAKAIEEFGKTAEEQLDAINQELARLNDAKARSAADIYLRTQKALDDEMERITTVTDKDEAMLVSSAMGNISDKKAREALAKFKGATNAASIITFLNGISPAAAAEFTAGYEGAKDAIINNRSKGSKIQNLQRDLQYKATLLKDPGVLGYVALGLNEEPTAAPAPKTPGVMPLDDLFGIKPKETQPAKAPEAAVVPVVPVAPPPQAPIFPYVPTPDRPGNINTRRNNAVTDTLYSAAQSVGNFLTPSNWRPEYRSDSIIPIPDAISLQTPDETIVAQLLDRFNALDDKNSPRAARIRNELYDLTSPAAYINSRPNYFTGSR